MRIKIKLSDQILNFVSRLVNDLLREENYFAGLHVQSVLLIVVHVWLFSLTIKVTLMCNQCCLYGNGGCWFSNEVSGLCCDLYLE